MGSRISCETGFVSKCCHTKARKPVIGFLVAEANCVAACGKSCVVPVERTGAESILFSLESCQEGVSSKLFMRCFLLWSLLWLRFFCGDTHVGAFQKGKVSEKRINVTFECLWHVLHFLLVAGPQLNAVVLQGSARFAQGFDSANQGQNRAQASRKLAQAHSQARPSRATTRPCATTCHFGLSTLLYSELLFSGQLLFFPFLQIKRWCPLRSWGRTVGLNCLVGVPEIQEFLPQHCKLVKLTSDIKRPLDSASHGPQTSCSGGQKGLFVVPESSSKTVLFKLVLPSSSCTCGNM